MNHLLQILLFLLTWLTTFANATPLAQKITISDYSISFSPTENQKLESEVKIVIQNFARSAISEKSDHLNATSRENYVLEESRARMSGEDVNGAGRQFSLLAEEALGGHSIARHGPQLTLLEMEQRVLGIHPTIPQSRSALRFETQAIHEDAVNKAFTQYGDEIDAFFTNPNNTYKEWTFDYGSKVGSGYTNTGTLSNPLSQAVTSNKITISLKRVASSPRGYRLESAFPDIR